MSTFNRNTLALALAAALLPASAFAYDAQTAGDAVPETIAQQVGTTLATTEAFTINIAAGDNIIGRTQGFNIKLTLLDGAQFATTGNLLGGVTAGAGLVAGATPWNTSVVGGAPGTTVLQVQLSNNSDGAFVGPGALLGPVTFDLQGVSTTGLTRVLVELIDPGTGAVIQNGASTFSFTSNIIVRSDGLAFSCLAQPNADLIDVAGDGGAIGPKTEFVPFNAAIGIGPFSPTAELGTITLATTGGFTVAGTDTIHSVITGTNLANISSLFLATTGSNCAAPIVGATYAIDLVTNTAKLGGDVAPLSAAGDGVTATSLSFGATGGDAELCVTVNGTGQIAAQQFTVVNGFNNALESDACPVAPIAFNGSVVKVFTFNPAGNTTQESFARVSNWGNTGGKVTVEGWDDTGAAAPGGNVTFNLAAGETVQFNSTDLENGGVTGGGKALTGALGNGTGKWRLIVTGEFDGMAVTSLNRNNTTGTLTNLTDADNRGEQVNDGK